MRFALRPCGVTRSVGTARRLLLSVITLSLITFPPSFAQEDKETPEFLPPPRVEAAPTKPRVRDKSAKHGKIAGPRDLLSLMDVDDSDFKRLTDGYPIGLEEQDLLVKLLHAVGRMEPVHVERWTKQNQKFSWEDLVKLPVAHRGQFFPVRGHVTNVSRVRALPELAERFELPGFYRCEVVTTSDQEAVVYTEHVPEAWQIENPMKQRVSFQGLFLKLAAGAFQDPNTPVFVARRVAWHPPSLLGNQHVDLGLFAGVRHHTKLLTLEDHDGFYQILVAMGRISQEELNNAAEQAVETLKPLRGNKKPTQFHVAQLFVHAAATRQLRREIRELDDLSTLYQQALDLGVAIRAAAEKAKKAALLDELQQIEKSVAALLDRLDAPKELRGEPVPQRKGVLDAWVEQRLANVRAKLQQQGQSPNAQGQPMVFQGTLRHAVKVQIEDDVIRERFGIDHYYQATVFVDLGGRFKLHKERERVFTEYPVYFALRDWPADMPLGERVTEQVRISGVFFKIWSYVPGYAESPGQEKVQDHLAPLLIGRGPVWYRETSEDRSLYAMIGGGLFLLVLLSVVVWLTRTSRGDRKFRKQIDKKLGPDGDVSLDDLKLD